MEEYLVEGKSNVDKLLDFLVFIAVFVVTIFLILELLAGDINLDVVALNDIYFYVNIAVFLVFLADLVRLWKETDTSSHFFRESWLDILATIPFGLIGMWIGYAAGPQNPANAIAKWFRVVKGSRVARFQKASRASKISKEFKAAAHMKREGEESKKKHRL